MEKYLCMENLTKKCNNYDGHMTKTYFIVILKKYKIFDKKVQCK